MLHTHHRTLARITRDRPVKFLLRDYFDLPRWQALLPAMAASGLGQADLVLALLRIRDRHRDPRLVLAVESYIAALVGHPIQRGPSCLVFYRTNGPSHARLDRSPRIAWVTSQNPRQPGTDAYLRWSEYKVGRSVAQLRMRGIKAKDLRVAKRNGWIKLEEVVQ